MKSNKDNLTNQSALLELLLAPLFEDPHGEEQWDRLLSTILDEEIPAGTICALVPTIYSLGEGTQSYVWQRTVIMAKAGLLIRHGPGPGFPESLLVELSDVLERFGADLLANFRSMNEPRSVRSALGFLAVWKGQNVYATALLEYSEEELREFFVV